uniref:Uncharacterized protein n=1 Tax=Anopheles atroparvus TaxID=41427 RepID=A0AAG5CX20_ANOAO
MFFQLLRKEPHKNYVLFNATFPWNHAKETRNNTLKDTGLTLVNTILQKKNAFKCKLAY